MLTSSLLQSGYPTYSREYGQDYQKVYVYEVPRDTATDYFPLDGDQDPEGEEGYWFKRASLSAGDTPNSRRLTVYYGPSDGYSMESKREVGSVVFESSATMSFQNIEDHPNATSAEWLAEQKAKGVNSYRVAELTVTRSEIKDGSKVTLTESFLKGNLMQKVAPAGVYGCNSNYWMCIGRSIRFDGTQLDVRDEYLYNANQFPSADFNQSGS